MSARPETIGPDETVQRAAEKMRTANIGLLPVCSADRLIGVVTDRDITVRATALGRDPTLATVSEVMTPQVLWCFEDESIAEAARFMADKAVRRVLVLSRSRRLVGILSVDDIARTMGEQWLAGEVVGSAARPEPHAP